MGADAREISFSWVEMPRGQGMMPLPDGLDKFGLHGQILDIGYHG